MYCSKVSFNININKTLYIINKKSKLSQKNREMLQKLHFIVCTVSF